MFGKDHVDGYTEIVQEFTYVAFVVNRLKDRDYRIIECVEAMNRSFVEEDGEKEKAGRCGQQG
jgi:hypothetical protein